jgi:hypothetical protein
VTRTRALAAAALIVVALATVSADVAGARRERAPARLMVSAQEHSLTLSRQRIAAGPAVIQFLNRGEDPHDLRLRRIARPGVSARRTLGVQETSSGELAELEARLPAGRYRLWCSIQGHEQLGMRARLRVVRTSNSR